MKNNIWAKTLLKAYRYLERIADAIDTLVERTATNSFYVTGSNFVSNSIMAVSDKIIALSERKVTLINLKILIEKALAGMKSERAEMLISRYFDGENTNLMAAKYKLPLRTFFRHLSKAEEEFMLQLSKEGYNESKLNKMLENEKWLLGMYQRLKGNDDAELCDKYVERAACL